MKAPLIILLGFILAFTGSIFILPGYFAEQNDASSTEEATTNTDADVVVDMTAVDYEFSEKVIQVTEGDTVVINVTSEEGTYDISIDAFGGVTSPIIEAGETATITFVADKPGVYQFYSSIGNQRDRGMAGSLVVSPE